MKERDSGQLKGELSRLRSWVTWGAIAVIVGLIIEVWLAVSFHRGEGLIEKWGSVLATALIALGVLAETIFGHKGDAVSDTLEKLAEQRTAEANARAAEAQLKLAELWERVAPRVVTPEMRQKLKGLQGLVTEIALTWQRTAEPAIFCWKVAGAMRQPGMIVQTPPSPPGAWAVGIFVVYPAAMDELRRKAIAEVLACIGASDSTSQSPPWDLEDSHLDSVVIFVGDNPRMFADAP